MARPPVQAVSDVLADRHRCNGYKPENYMNVFERHLKGIVGGTGGRVGGDISLCDTSTTSVTKRYRSWEVTL